MFLRFLHKGLKTTPLQLPSCISSESAPAFHKISEALKQAQEHLRNGRILAAEEAIEPANTESTNITDESPAMTSFFRQILILKKEIQEAKKNSL